MSTLFPANRSRGGTVPGNADKNAPHHSTTRIRPDAYAALIRLDTDGLQSCGGDCSQSWPLWRCEHHELEARLGYALNPARPSDLAIGVALRLIAAQCDYEGADHETPIIRASNAGLITPETRNRLLSIEHEIRERDLEDSVFELLTTRYGRSSIGSGRDRRWRSDLDDDERRERRRLEQLRFNAGLAPEDRVAYENLTEPQPLDPIDWHLLPDGLRDDAERLLGQRRRRARGELPRSVRVSATDRRRRPTFEVPSFRAQIGAIATASTTAEIERAVRDLRRAAKRRGLLPAEHDRRRGVSASTGPVRGRSADSG
jgi:hypothetical protein